MSEEQGEPDRIVVEYTPLPRMRESLAAGLAEMRARISALKPEEEGARQKLSEEIVRCKRADEAAAHGRTQEGAELSRALESVRELWRPIVDGFKSLRRDLDSAMTKVLTHERDREEKLRKEREAELERQRLIQAELDRKAAEGVAVPKAQVQASLIDLRHARAAVDELPVPGVSKGVTLETGTVSAELEWDWEVQDLKAVPDEYTSRVIDKKKVDAAVASGVRSVAGLRIFERAATAARPKRS